MSFLIPDNQSSSHLMLTMLISQQRLLWLSPKNNAHNQLLVRGYTTIRNPDF